MSSYRQTARLALGLLLYLVFGMPLLYVAANYDVAPVIPLTWAPVVLSTLLIALTRVRPEVQEGHGAGALAAVILYAWVTVIILLGVDARSAAPIDYGNFLASHIAIGGGFLIAGLSLPAIAASLEVKWGRRSVLTAASLATLALLCAAMRNPYSDVLPWYLLGISKPDTGAGEHFDYLFVSDSLAMLFLLVLSQLRSFMTKAATALAAGVLLFWTSSRSALACFGLVALAILFKAWSHLRPKQRLLTLSGTAGLVLVLAAMTSPLTQLGAGTQLERFDLSTFQDDKSLQEREEISVAGAARLEHEWLLGHFMSEVIEGRKGYYIHNVLSFWDAYGLGPFTLFCVLYAATVVCATHAFMRRPPSPGTELLFGFSWFIGLSLVLSRSYGTHQVWFVLAGGSAFLKHRGVVVQPHLQNPIP